MKKKNEAAYEILYDLPSGDQGDTKVISGIRTRTIRAGESLEIEVYPILRHWGEEARREAKRRRSGAAKEANNRRRAITRFRRLAEANFNRNSYALTLTLDYGFQDRFTGSIGELWSEYAKLGYPLDDKEARQQLVNYLNRVKYFMRKRGLDPKKLKYMYVIESTKEPDDSDPNPMPPRYHYHLIIDAPDLTRDDLEALWGKGYTKAERLDFRNNGLEALTAYMSKQPRFYSEHRWACSKNLKQPEERISDRAISRRRAAQIAEDVQANGREILEKIYPGYRLERADVRYSEFVPGAYIYARLRKIPQQGGKRK